MLPSRLGIRPPPSSDRLARGSVSETLALERPRRRRHWWYIRGTLKVMALFFVVWFIVIPLIPGFQKASHDVNNANPWYILTGFVLELLSLFSYSMLTKTALPEPTP